MRLDLEVTNQAARQSTLRVWRVVPRETLFSRLINYKDDDVLVDDDERRLKTHESWSICSMSNSVMIMQADISGDLFNNRYFTFGQPKSCD